MYGGVVLRVVRSDGGDGSMCGGLLLRGSIEYVYAFPVSIRECELRGGDVCVVYPWDGERHLSSGSLLSSGVSRSFAVSSGHEHVIDGSSQCDGLSGVCEGVLLS